MDADHLVSLFNCITSSECVNELGEMDYGDDVMNKFFQSTSQDDLLRMTHSIYCDAGEILWERAGLQLVMLKYWILTLIFRRYGVEAAV